MILIECDKCGKAADRNAYEIQVASIHNPTPQYIGDIGNLRITDEPGSRIRFILCQECYRRIGLPNIYKCINKNRVDWERE